MYTQQNQRQVYDACAKLAAKLPDGTVIPRLGQGTWKMGDRDTLRSQEIQALKIGIDYGMTLIDTAEMYGEGRSEQLIGEAIRGLPRESLYLVSKVYPHNAGAPRIFESCKNSLRRLGTDYLDLYLLHWRGSIPLAETVECMEQLVSQGLIRRWGVSNFDTDDMQALWKVPGGSNCAVNQVLYHLGSRGIEFDLLPWMHAHGVLPMAYCPIAQGGRLRRDMLAHPAVRSAAQKHAATSIQILLAFLLAQSDVICIPKAGQPAHAQENAHAALVQLDEAELSALSQAFPAPTRKTPLDIL